MSSSGNWRVAIICATVLLFFHVQGHQKNGMSDEFYTDGPHPNCCKTTSLAKIKERVKSCYEQRANTFRNCKIHSYIFVTVSNKTFCVDPYARWLKSRLRKLATRGITCKVL